MRNTTKAIIATLGIVLATGLLAAPADVRDGLAERTVTELGQRVDNYSLPSGDTSDSGWIAPAAGIALALALAAGTVVVLGLRRHRDGDSHGPLAGEGLGNEVPNPRRP